MIKKITLSILTLVVIILLFSAAFFAFAPEDRVHGFKIWRESRLGDPIARCIQYHRDDFLAPNSVRYIDIYPGESTKDSLFAIKVSAITQGGGRGYQYIDCIGGKSADYTNFTGSKIREAIRYLDEQNALLEKKIEREKRERERR